MNTHDTSVIRELTVIELDEVAGGGKLLDIFVGVYFGALGAKILDSAAGAGHSAWCCEH
jgi:hypothetical protein